MKNLQVKLVGLMLLVLWLWALSIPVKVQGGGKAEPKRIQFKTGATAATVTDQIRHSLEHDYVFSARTGQKVILKITSNPRGKFTAFRLRGDGFDFVSDYDINYEYGFTAPETGDYLVFVFMRPTDKVKSATYHLTLTIRN